MKRIALIIIAVAIVVGLPVAGLRWSASVKAKKAAAAEAANGEYAVAVEITPARRGSIERTYTITGSVEADHESNVISKIGGKVSRVLVDEGDRVAKGQVLAQLESADLQAQLRQATAAVTAAQARVRQAEAGVGLTKTQTNTGIQTAEAAVASARLQLQQLETAATVTKTQTSTSVEQAKQAVKAAEAQLEIAVEGARRQQVEQAGEGVTQAKAGLENARTNLRRAETLLAQGAVSQQQYDAAKLAFDVAQSQYNSASQGLDLVREGSRSQEVDMARAQLEQARQALILAQANDAQNRISEQQIQSAREQVRSAEAALRLARAAEVNNYITEEDVQAARAALGQAQASVGYIQTQIGYTSIRAPMAGVITRRWVSPGESAGGSPLFTITDNNSVFIRASLPETLLGNAEVGDEVAVSVDALPEESFIGDITELIPSADTKTRSFDIKVRSGNAGGRLKQGMFGRVVIVTDCVDNAVIIPRSAVVSREGKDVVMVVRDKKAVELEVVTGLNDVENVAILEGLSDGEQVITAGQTIVKANEAVSVVTGGKGVRQ